MQRGTLVLNEDTEHLQEFIWDFTDILQLELFWLSARTILKIGQTPWAQRPSISPGSMVKGSRNNDFWTVIFGGQSIRWGLGLIIWVAAKYQVVHGKPVIFDSQTLCNPGFKKEPFLVAT